MEYAYITNKEITIGKGTPIYTVRNEYCKVLAGILNDLADIPEHERVRSYSTPIGKITFEINETYRV